MKKFLIVLGIVVSLLVCIAVFKDPILKSMLTRAASKFTGTQVHIDGFSLNTFNSTIHISGFKVYNPSGFPEGTLMFCSNIDLIYDPATIFNHARHFLLMEIEIDEIGVTHTEVGELNVDSLKFVQQISSRTPMQIDLLVLSIGKIVHKDYKNGAEPSVRVYDVNKYNSYTNITSSKQLALLVFTEPMKIAALDKAGIYGVAEVAGVTVLRVAGQSIILGKDYVREIIDTSFERLYEVSLAVAKRMGTVTKDDAPDGAIKAKINGAMVAIQLRKKSDHAAEITISARTFIFPKLDIAGGVLYQILDKLQSLESDD